MTTPDPTTDDEPETVEAEVSEVLDPEDYNQNQRLKQIHEARRDVRKALREVTKGAAEESEHIATRTELATRVAYYGIELGPLMDSYGWEHEFSDSFPYDDVRHFVSLVGALPPDADDYEYGPPPQASLKVFRKLSAFARSVGLGVDLDDDTDEWEV